ncbi:MAG: ROK family protein [Leptolyngbyaceae cyanobacterium CRU_2_3]|nr:ROK family protein [Leptolyngbyaceae cyanobacterium CRU_2_3]
MSPLLLALDFGGTKHAAALVQLDAIQAGTRPSATRPSATAQWQAYQRALSPSNANAEVDLAIMRSLIQSLLNGAQPDAIGVSFGGPVDFTTGTVRLSHHVPGWENLPLKQLLETEWGVPVSVDNDANVAALGEHRFGAGRETNSLMYITVSTGVGGGWILNNQPWRGAAGMAGEIGHTVVDPQGPLCLCGKRGCVERLASGPYMVQQLRDRLQQEPDRGEILRSLVLDQTALTAQHISQAAAQGDALAQEVLQQAAEALGTGIGNAANLINPQCFILGGGVTKAGEQWWQGVRQSARQTALPEVNFAILPAELGEDAPLWGAIALAQPLISPSAQ